MGFDLCNDNKIQNFIAKSYAKLEALENLDWTNLIDEKISLTLLWFGKMVCNSG